MTSKVSTHQLSSKLQGEKHSHIQSPCPVEVGFYSGACQHVTIKILFAGGLLKGSVILIEVIAVRTPQASKSFEDERQK